MDQNNNNQQLSYLFAKIEEQEQTIRELIGTCRELEMRLDEAIDDMEFFNSLPWYEKMFHKFDLV